MKSSFINLCVSDLRHIRYRRETDTRNVKHHMAFKVFKGIALSVNGFANVLGVAAGC